MSSNEFRGSKYVQGMRTAEIAKAIRADVAAAKKAGQLPKSLKVSVRCETFSMGSSIDIRVTGGAGVDVYNPLRLAWEREQPHASFALAPREVCAEYSPAMAAVVATLEALAKAYHRDNSDSSTDYSDTNFYLDVGVRLSAADEAVARDYALEHAGREAA